MLNGKLIMCEKIPTAVIKSKRDEEKGHRMSAGREIRPEIIKNSEESIMNEKCGIDVMLRDGAKGRDCL